MKKEAADVRQFAVRGNETEQEIASAIEKAAQAGVALCYFNDVKVMEEWKNRLAALC